jgi:hypothetical protein
MLDREAIRRMIAMTLVQETNVEFTQSYPSEEKPQVEI